MTAWDVVYLVLTLALTGGTLGLVALFARLERRS